MARPLPLSSSPSSLPLPLEDYDVDLEFGFLPHDPPLKRLPDPYYEPWERLVDKLNHFILAGRLRDAVLELPLLSIHHLTSKPEYRRAFVVLCFLSHAYIWCNRHHPSQVLPAPLAVPLVAVAEHLELNPVLCCAAVCLWNWQFLDDCDNDGTHMSRHLSNITTIHTFTGSSDESWFYLNTVAIEAHGGPVISAILHAIDAIARDDIDAITSELSAIADTIARLIAIIRRIPEACDPHIFYWHIRSYFAGGENMERAGLPYGVLYQGVDDAGIESDPVGSPAYCDRFRRYAGGSAAQSSLIQVLDIALGVTHYPTNINSSRSGSPLSAPLSPTSSSHRQSLVPPTPPSEGDDPERPPLSNRHPDLTFPPPPASPNSYLLRMRDYMPGPHRRFLEDLAKVCRIREYVVNAICGGSETRYCEQASRRLHEAYNICVQRLKQFRDHHIQIVTRYIVIPARKGATVIRPPVTSSAPPSPVPVPAAAAAAAATAKPKPMDRVHTLAGQDAIKGDTGRNHYLGLRLHSPPASPPLSEFSPRSKNLPFTYGKGPQGGYSPSSEAIMYPQTNSPPTPLSASAAYHQNWQGAGLGLARQAEGGEVLRGTGGTDAIKFLKQVRDETKSSCI